MLQPVLAHRITSPNSDQILASEVISGGIEVDVVGGEDGVRIVGIGAAKLTEIIETEGMTGLRRPSVMIEEVENDGAENHFEEVEDLHLLRVEADRQTMDQGITGMHHLSWILTGRGEGLAMDRCQGAHPHLIRYHIGVMAEDEGVVGGEGETFMMIIELQAAVAHQNLVGIAGLSRQLHLPRKFLRLARHQPMSQLL